MRQPPSYRPVHGFWGRRVPVLALSAAILVPACRMEPATGGVTALEELFAQYWEFRLDEDPLLATSVGDHRADQHLPSVTVEAERRRAERASGFLDRLRAIDRSSVGRQDRISYDMLERELEIALRDFELGAYRFPMTVDDGFHIGFARLPANHPFRNSDDYRSYIARLDGWPLYVEEHLALLRDGLATGMTLPRVILEGYEVTIETHVVQDPTTSVFYAPFSSFPVTVPASDTASLRAQGIRAIQESVVPGYESFRDFMAGEYVPDARTSIGAFEMPGGRAYYDHQIRVYTTLDDVTAEEIHRIGLDEVARIRSDMEAIIDDLEFADGFPAFLEFLRTDPRFYASTPEDLLKEAAYIAKEMDGKLPSLFGRLPRLPYGIQPVPDHLAPKYTGGRYIRAPVGGTRPGYYWVNTYALESRPLYVLPSLTLHEAVPGHHLQNALRQELDGLPSFRRFSSNSAYGEGWGLYSEYLGVEAGIYKTPYQHFGRLTYEMWRACRLVVDTGMHALGWTRQEAMDFMAANTALSLHEIRTETDRYISWPGQALAYKLGELKIKELRARAEQALGEAFDVRAFHDLILANGAVPLTVLETQVDAWISDSAAS